MFVFIILTIALCIVLLGGAFVLYDPDLIAQQQNGIIIQDIAIDTAAEAEATQVIFLTLASGELLEISQVIEPNNIAPAQILRDPTNMGTANSDGAVGGASQAQDSIVLQVTGSRVNMRSGPSTDNGVVDALVNGTRVDLIRRLDNGWMEIRVQSSGLSGYMAERFLERVN